MPRAYIDKTGFKVAATGKDARTATGIDIQMSSDFSNFSLYANGIATLINIQEQPPGVATAQYRNRQGIVNFGKTFLVPPMAFCCAIKPNGYGFCASTGNYDTGATKFVVLPDMYWITTTTQLLIYVACDVSPGDGFQYFGPDASSAAYYILENTIQ